MMVIDEDLEILLGAIYLFPYPFVPKKWLICDGRSLPTAQYEPLFSLLGNTYGGDGKTTFALPNLIGAEPHPNMKYCIAYSGIFPQRP
ncbi:phage tail protein [Desulfitobacterium hafniense]|uniref:Phage tail collar domain-containing protein n=3 Tax=Desulfitobacterium hafniense TaxID=49338 RepID=Q250H0_DESHY|nr:phage tail protein [Desulfitobacterium hafniense]EHL07820.1 phage tail collar domain protein [Desulfitobacterium hafniense DP7]KTE92959.1 phage tail protein [Desulfitobacterium hafniense]BAE82322.1 hypothetical protein DSY0533 [Desulfitobacterium hafniense Y51]